jgi:hypothetical protein
VTRRKVTSGGRQGSDSGLAGPAEPGPRAPGGMARSLLAEPGGSPRYLLSARAVPLPVPVPTGSATARSDWTLGYLRRPTFKLARKPRHCDWQGLWVLTQGKSTLIAIASALRLATVPWWAEVRCHSGIDHGDGAPSLGSCVELGGAAAGMLGPAPDRPIEPGIEPGPGSLDPGDAASWAAGACRASSRGLQRPRPARARTPARARWAAAFWALATAAKPPRAFGASGPARWHAGCAGNFSRIRDQPRGGAAPGGHAANADCPGSNHRVAAIGLGRPRRSC